MNPMVTQGLGTVLGIGTQMIGNQMQLGQQEQLQQMQIAGQQEMGRFNKQMAMDMWHDTNYDAQRKEMEKAGLNVGLMYGGGGGGGGGGTSNVQAGNVSSSQASSDTKAMEGIGMMNQSMIQAAQVENIKADTEKKNAETEEVKQRTPTHSKGMEKTDAEIQEIATRLGVNIETAKKLIQEVKESQSRVTVNEHTIPKIEKEISKMDADINKTNAETNRIKTLLPEEVKKIRNDIYTSLEAVEQGWKRLSLEARTQEINKFKEEMKVKYPSMSEAGGRVMNNIVNQTLRLLGLEDDEYEGSYKVRE